MSLSNKIFTEKLQNYRIGEWYLLEVKDVREAVKQLKEAVLRNIDVWSNMTEEQVKAQLDYLWEQYFGEKLI